MRGATGQPQMEAGHVAKRAKQLAETVKHAAGDAERSPTRRSASALTAGAGTVAYGLITTLPVACAPVEVVTVTDTFFAPLPVGYVWLV